MQVPAEHSQTQEHGKKKRQGHKETPGMNSCKRNTPTSACNCSHTHLQFLWILVTPGREYQQVCELQIYFTYLSSQGVILGSLIFVKRMKQSFRCYHHGSRLQCLKMCMWSLDQIKVLKNWNNAKSCEITPSFKVLRTTIYLKLNKIFKKETRTKLFSHIFTKH